MIVFHNAKQNVKTSLVLKYLKSCSYFCDECNIIALSREKGSLGKPLIFQFSINTFDPRALISE